MLVFDMIPPETQLSAMDSLIDSMMLVEEDEDGKQKDMLKVHHIPNPSFQRHFQVLQLKCKSYYFFLSWGVCVTCG